MVGEADRTATGSTVGIFDEYAYWAAIDPIELNPNTTYWISIVNDTSADTDDVWFWFFSDQQTGIRFQSRDVDTTTWSGTSFNNDLAFQLTNDIIVTEPSSMALFVLGLAGVSVLARGRSRCRGTM